MKVGIIGASAIAQKHAQAFRNIGFKIAASSNGDVKRGEAFAQCWNADFIPDYRELCRLPNLDLIDVCTYPALRLEPVEICAATGRPVQLEKPMATQLNVARRIVELAHSAQLPISVVSQHRFNDSTIFLKRAIEAGRLGKLLEADAYVKWHRSEHYYARPIKGSWSVEGGGALINQAIHQVDLLLYLVGPIARVRGMWQLGARHRIESEDIVNALLLFENGATGVLQASTAFSPGYAERIEIHGSKGTAIVSGDRLTRWDVEDDEEANAADAAPVQTEVSSGASDPMAISLRSFERVFQDFARSIQGGTEPVCSAEAGYRALETVLRIYDSCRAES